MRVLVIDTETTGLPRSDLHPSDEEQSRLVQFAAALFDQAGRERCTVNLIVNPGVEVPEGASAIHGITNADVAAFGVREKGAVGIFLRLLGVADVVTGYTVRFDLKQIDLAAQRAGVAYTMQNEIRDVCAAVTPIVNLPATERMKEWGHGDKPKPPKLGEAFEHFFGRPMVGAHDALADVRAAAQIYWELEARGVWKAAAA